MNYNKIYSNIVRRALLQNRKKSNGVYFEKHHILPKCLGGNDKKDNLVLLTFKEHFICHQLLYKMYENTENAYKLMYALHRMYLKGNNNGVVKSGKFYEEVREKFCKQQSDRAKLRVGRKCTEETKKKIGLIHKGKSISEEHKNKIKKYSNANKELTSKITKENHLKGVYKNSNKLKELWKNEDFKKNISGKIKENYINNPKLKKDTSDRIKTFRKNNPNFLSNSKNVYFKDIVFKSMKEASIYANMKYPTFVWNIKNNINFQYSLKAFNL